MYKIIKLFSNILLSIDIQYDMIYVCNKQHDMNNMGTHSTLSLAQKHFHYETMKL